ncbi:MAG: methyltransferase family protein [Flavisolibacter sp.]
MLPDHLLLALMWILYGVVHSVLAHPGVKIRLQKLLGKSFRYYRIFYVVFAFVTLAGVLLFQITIAPVLLFKATLPVMILGGMVTASGLLLMLVCIRKYFMSLSGLRSLFFAKDSHELIITGVHRYIRHPLYLGTFIFIWGILLILPHLSLLVMNLVVTIYTLIGIKLEEDKLVEEFGQAYIEYRKKVPALLPRLKRTSF